MSKIDIEDRLNEIEERLADIEQERAPKTMSKPAPAASPWVALSEREPNFEDWDENHKIEACDYAQRSTFSDPATITSRNGWLYWRRVELPPLPAPPQPEARQVSQEDKDRLAFHGWYLQTPQQTPHWAWNGALAHERRYLGMPAECFREELRKILHDYDSLNNATGGFRAEALRALLAKAPTKP